MPKILLMRHAEPVITGVFLGALDLGLREPVAPVPPWSGPVLTSPLLRARQTAARTGGHITIEADLREIHYGPWEGLTWQEIEQRFPLDAAAKLADWKGHRIPGAEAWDEFTTRITGVYAKLQVLEQDTLVVAHLGVNAVLYELATGNPALTFQQNYLDIVTIQL